VLQCRSSLDPLATNWTHPAKVNVNLLDLVFQSFDFLVEILWRAHAVAIVHPLDMVELSLLHQLLYAALFLKDAQIASEVPVRDVRGPHCPATLNLAQSLRQILFQAFDLLHSLLHVLLILHVA